MKVCVDVDYRGESAIAAAVVFQDWADVAAQDEKVLAIAEVQPYEPGAFYKRELPCLLAVLATLPPAKVIVVDGYVWLGDGRPGLGAHLWHALGQGIAVVGVAKTRFAGARAVEVVRGTEAKRPLYVTAAGIDVEEAAAHVQGMHGPHRLPTLLKRVDTLCRS